MKLKIKFKQLFLMIIMLIPLITPVYASEQTSLKTTIPTQHYTKIVINGERTIVIDGVVYHQGDTIRLKRGQSYQFIFNAKQGYQINRVIFNGEDVTQRLNGNTYQSDGIYQDGTLEVEYGLINKVKKENVNSTNKVKAVATGDQRFIFFFYAMTMLSIVLILVLIKSMY